MAFGMIPSLLVGHRGLDLRWTEEEMLVLQGSQKIGFPTCQRSGRTYSAEMTMCPLTCCF